MASPPNPQRLIPHIVHECTIRKNADYHFVGVFSFLLYKVSRGCDGAILGTSSGYARPLHF